jgi:hypothetical protein
MYIFRGVAEEHHASVYVHGDTLGRHPLPEGVVGESPVARALLPLAPCSLAPAAVWLAPPVVPAMLLVEFLVVPVCAYVHSS